MQTIKLYIKDWLAIHPYIQQQATDRYFVDLANRLYSTCTIRKIPESIKKKLCLYTAAYFEDVISGLGLWQAFIKNIWNYMIRHFLSIPSAGLYKRMRSMKKISASSFGTL